MQSTTTEDHGSKRKNAKAMANFCIKRIDDVDVDVDVDDDDDDDSSM